MSDDFWQEIEEERTKILSDHSPVEIEIREILESWFGESLENMENWDQFEKYVWKPIRKALK